MTLLYDTHHFFLSKVDAMKEIVLDKPNCKKERAIDSLEIPGYVYFYCLLWWYEMMR